VGFVVDKMALGNVFSEYFGFPYPFSFQRMLHIHHHLSSGAGTVGQTVAAVSSGLILTPPQETKKAKTIAFPTIWSGIVVCESGKILNVKIMYDRIVSLHVQGVQ
jgi:hypothetical protein